MIKLDWFEKGKFTPYKTLRSELGLTRQEMAVKLDISIGAYHYLERGYVYPSPGVFFKTLEVFDNVTLEDLREYYREREKYIEDASLRKNTRARRKEAEVARGT